MIAEYLNVILKEGNDSDVITAIGHLVKSFGMIKIAQETGLSKPSLYKALSDGAKPQFETIMKVLRAIGGTNKNRSSDCMKPKRITTSAMTPYHLNLKLMFLLIQNQLNLCFCSNSPNGELFRLLKKHLGYGRFIYTHL